MIVSSVFGCRVVNVQPNDGVITVKNPKNVGSEDVPRTFTFDAVYDSKYVTNEITTRKKFLTRIAFRFTVRLVRSVAPNSTICTTKPSVLWSTPSSLVSTERYSLMDRLGRGRRTRCKVCIIVSHYSHQSHVCCESVMLSH